MTPGDRKQRNKRRRAAVRHAMLTRAPVRLSGGRLARVKPGGHFETNGRTINLPDLPDELCGLKIAHLSDPHVGEFITPAHLPQIVDAVNGLGADLIAATGDFIDFSNEHLPAVVEALAQLEAPLGVYFVLGNHDHLDNAEEVVAAFRAADLNLLMNEATAIEYAETPVALGGIDWAGSDVELRRSVRKVARQMNPAPLSILLAHHPHAFDAAVKQGVHLTLSGHTHGGHFLVSDKRGKKGSIGLGNLAFRYTRGLYMHGASALFVSSGVGSWFPLRFRCPAEITLLELQNTW